MSEHSLFPHQRLDWIISDLESKIKRSGASFAFLLQLMKAHLSKGLFHDGGEKSCSDAVHIGTKLLQESPESLDVLGLMALSLVGIDRQQQAVKYIETAQKIDMNNAFVQLALSFCAQADNQKLKSVVYHLQKAVSLAPKAWELHLRLGRIYLYLAQEKHAGEKKYTRKATQSLYHLIQAVLFNPFLGKKEAFLRDIGLACILNNRFKEAERYFSRLKTQQKDQADSRYYMGLATFKLEKYNNAIQHFRWFMKEHPDRDDVLLKQAESFYHLEEYGKAKETALKVLQMHSNNISARLLLGKSILAQGEISEALRIFRETLVMEPSHLASFSEIVRIRREDGDIEWLSKSLCGEVEQYGSPSSAMHNHISLALRKRIGVILQEMMQLGSEALPEVLRAINYSQDENLRFALWEVTCVMAENDIAEKCEEKLEQPARNFSLTLGELLLTIGERLPEEKLIRGMFVTDDDISKAAIDRHPPAHDVKQHEQNKQKQAIIAQGYKGLLLLTIASTKTEHSRKFLREYGLKVPNRDEKVAANIGLMLNGDVHAFEEVEKIAKSIDRRRNIHNIRMSLQKPANISRPKELISATEVCQLCKQSGNSIAHFLQTSSGTICNLCIGKSQRAAIAKDDASCVFCTKNFVLTKRIYSYENVDICFECYEHSQMVSEKRLIDAYFTSLHQNFGR